MKHLMTLMALVVAVTAGAQDWIPWNPDADNNEIIGVEDLMALLSVYGSEFVLDVPDSEPYTLALQPAGHMNYFRCEGYCYSIGGHVATLTELAAFPDSLLFGIGDTIPMYNTYSLGTYHGEIIHLNEANQRRFWHNINPLTDNDDQFFMQYYRGLGYGAHDSGDESDNFSLREVQSKKFSATTIAGCVCAGQIANQ